MQSLSILNQIIDEEEGIYRVRFGDRVVYLTISADVYDEDTMCRPHLLIPELPNFPTTEWTTMRITRLGKGGHLQFTTSNEPLASVETIWHPQQIDVLSLEQTKRLRSGVHEVLYRGMPAVSKIATFAWQIPSMDRETWAYSVLDQHLGDHSRLSPQVLGHLTECGRVIGILLEQLEGRAASTADLPGCETALRQLHEIGLTHGDVNRYNFIVNQIDGTVRMVDFEHASAADETSANEELARLPSELEEDTGRGSSITR